MMIAESLGGMVLATVADQAWRRLEVSESYSSVGEAPLDFIEHYHRGIASLLVASRLKQKSSKRTIATTVRVTLIGQEALHDPVFGPKVPSNLVLASLLTGGLLLSLANPPKIKTNVSRAREVLCKDARANTQDEDTVYRIN